MYDEFEIIFESIYEKITKIIIILVIVWSFVIFNCFKQISFTYKLTKKSDIFKITLIVAALD